MFFDAERRRPQDDDLLTALLPGAGVGAALGLAVLVLVGAVAGGVLQLAPCYGGHQYRPWIDRAFGGAVLGVLFYTWLFGLPVAFLGAVAGGAVAFFLRRRRTSPARGRVTE